MSLKTTIALALLSIATVCSAQTPSTATIPGKAASTGVRAQKEVGDLIREFLAHVNDPAMRERFWADDLIYTSAAGKVRTKAEILANMRAEKPPSAPDTSTYSAPDKDMQIRQYGDVAVAAFQLVHQEGEKTDRYRNTGTFVKRDGKWQAVAWQATKIAP